MALKSMTGYGRGERSGSGLRVVCELSSVNRRQLDVRINLPRGLSVLEAKVTELIQGGVARGHVIGTIRVDVSTERKKAGVSIDEGMLSGYLAAFRRAAAAEKIPLEISMADLMKLPDLVQRSYDELDPETVWPLIQKTVRAALSEMDEMRKREGEHLADDLSGRFGALEKMQARIAKRAPRVPEHYRRVLKERLKAAGVEVPGTDSVLARELAVFADRCDISEELTRLESHFKQARKRLTTKGPAGRPLEFLVQEFGREVNTIGSKANDAKISELVIACKAELERIREQVQNVE